MKALHLVTELLEGDHLVERILGETSAHKSPGARIRMASFSEGPDPAMVIAEALDAAARAEKARSGDTPKKYRLRIRRSPESPAVGLTQKEVALILNISERGVRAIEKRALRKLVQNPKLQEIWRQYLAGDLSEQQAVLTPGEIRALFGLARNPAELQALLKAVKIVQG